jgi:hypothetical protein
MIMMDEVFVPEANLLPNVKGLIRFPADAFGVACGEAVCRLECRDPRR